MQFDYRAFGSVIRRLRKDRHLTQEVLSGFADIPRSHLSSIEIGLKKINLDTACKLAQSFDLPLSELLRLTEEETRKAESDNNTLSE